MYCTTKDEHSTLTHILEEAGEEQCDVSHHEALRLTPGAWSRIRDKPKPAHARQSLL